MLSPSTSLRTCLSKHGAGSFSSLLECRAILGGPDRSWKPGAIAAGSRFYGGSLSRGWRVCGGEPRYGFSLIVGIGESCRIPPQLAALAGEILASMGIR